MTLWVIKLTYLKCIFPIQPGVAMSDFSVTRGPIDKPRSFMSAARRDLGRKLSLKSAHSTITEPERGEIGAFFIFRI